MTKYILVAVLGLVAGCSKGGLDGKLDELSGIKEKMCACPDKACADAQHEAYIGWKKGNSKEDKPNEDQQKKFEALRTALQDCRHKFDAPGGAAPTAPTTPTTPTTP
jgi:hypothetical protein